VRVAVVGAGVAGLTAAVALQRDGHEVRVHERAAELRTGGFGFNFWTNASSLLHALGVHVPGEPFDHMNFRAGGKQRATMRIPAPGQPHMNVERGALLRALHHTLAPNTVEFSSGAATTAELLASGADLVVAADGVGSQLRPDVAKRQHISQPWAIWQAVIPTGGDLIEPGGGAVVLGRQRFYGIWRHPNGELCWFMEEPSLPLDATAQDVLAASLADDDPLVREVASITPVETLGQWLARDRRPTRHIIGDRVVAIGDAAHPMLPCIGQGACTSIEDGVALALALRCGDVKKALLSYRRSRLPISRVRVATAHFACTLRRPSPAATPIAATPLGVPFAWAAASWLRWLNRANRQLVAAAATR
jgi:2-polyprenyl-6-methoxyphenol hydroxylase-like FAD-dependent oxidoreductase